MHVVIKRVSLKTFRTVNPMYPDYVYTYTFEDGMTWRYWINSSYNIDGYMAGNDSDYTILFKPTGIMFNDKVWLDERIEAIDYFISNAAECVSLFNNIQVSLNGEVKLAKDMKVNDKVIYYDFDENK